MDDTKKNALAELEKELNAIADWANGGYGFTAIIKAKCIVAELAKVRMTSPMLLFNRPAADESVKAVDRCLEIAAKGVKDGK